MKLELELEWPYPVPLPTKIIGRRIVDNLKLPKIEEEKEDERRPTTVQNMEAVD